MKQIITDPIAGWFGTWSISLNAASILLRIAVSFFLSAVIGCERSNKRHSAGLRTFILVSLGSCTAMMTDIYLAENAGALFPALSTAAGIGVAIISTYSILYSSKSQIKGLTTAAGLWACSFLGLATGCGLYTAAAAGFAAVLCTLSLLPSLEIYLKNRSNHFEIHLELKDKHNLHDFITTIRKLGLIIDDIELNPAYLNSGLSVFSISLTIIAPELKKYKTHREIIDALKTLEYISYIEEIR
ncbi:MAG: MgtC/SapB family protein [Lachnospiraceae bacterium]|jgi:putative Mg2+ transporter-C (MgtC) family protein|nr:MgtC/SapB family protein [Lachnospiraceae bacterium]MCI1727636.1 MgtC/SapB family protein [Lachnospiraceae bacterium]